MQLLACISNSTLQTHLRHEISKSRWSRLRPIQQRARIDGSSRHTRTRETWPLQRHQKRSMRCTCSIVSSHTAWTAIKMDSRSRNADHLILSESGAQRAHGNFMESHMQVSIAMLISGLRYPITTASMGVAWSIFRVLYAVGYTRSDKTDATGRLIGIPHSFIQLGLYFMMAWTGYQMVNPPH